MIRTLPILAALALSHPVSAQDAAAPAELPPLTMEQQTSFRCGVAFGLLAGAQKAGLEEAMAYPAIEPRGQEFFVRVTARIMEDERFTREVLKGLVDAELDHFGFDSFATVEAVLPACLTLLDASGI